VNPLDEAKFKIHLSVKHRHVSPTHHEVEIEADNAHDAHTQAASRFGHASKVRIHRSFNMDRDDHRDRLKRYDEFSQNKSGGDAKPKVSAFPPKKPEEKREPPKAKTATKSGSAAHTFLNNVRSKAAMATNESESQVMRFKKSMELAGAERENLVKAIGSRDPDRVASARKKMRDRSSQLRRAVSRVREDREVKSFREFVVESSKAPKVNKAYLSQHLHDAQDDDSGWHTHDKKTDTHVVRRGFFYKHGRTSADHAKSVSDQLNTAGIRHKVVDHGEVYGKPFKGGASVKHQDHWWVKFRVEH
jgi:hypothetical protein